MGIFRKGHVDPQHLTHGVHRKDLTPEQQQRKQQQREADMERAIKQPPTTSGIHRESGTDPRPTWLNAYADGAEIVGAAVGQVSPAAGNAIEASGQAARLQAQHLEATEQPRLQEDRDRRRQERDEVARYEQLMQERAQRRPRRGDQEHVREL